MQTLPFYSPVCLDTLEGFEKDSINQRFKVFHPKRVPPTTPAGITIRLIPGIVSKR